MTEMYSGLHVSQRFSSLDEFKSVVRSISVRQHWELRVMRSNKKSVVIGCRSGSNCYFRVVCRSNKNATYITSLQDSHSCRRGAETPAATPARSEASHVRFLLSEIPKLFDMKSKITGQEVVDAVKRYHGYDISMRQAQRALIKLQPRPADSQGEQSLDLDMSVEDPPSPSQSSPESPEDVESTYRAVSESRWLPETLPPTMMEENPMDLADSTGSSHAHPAPAPHPRANPQTVRPSIPQPPPIGNPPNHSPLENHDPQPMVSQPGLGYPHGSTLPLAGPEHKPPGYPHPPRNNHPPVPTQMFLTPFKVVFTCTSCGSTNEGFFPPPGDVADGIYMGHHPAPTQSPVARHPVAHPPAGPSHDVAENGAYAVNALNARVMQNAWAAGSLGVPIGPQNT